MVTVVSMSATNGGRWLKLGSNPGGSVGGEHDHALSLTALPGD